MHDFSAIAASAGTSTKIPEYLKQGFLREVDLDKV
jgi:hypothetical protein